MNGADIIDWAKRQWQRHQDYGDDVVGMAYDSPAAVLKAFALKADETRLERRLICHERIAEKAGFRRFHATADAGYAEEGNNNRLSVMITTSLDRERGRFTKPDPVDVVIADFVKTTGRDGKAAWRFDRLGYRQGTEPLQFFTADQVGQHRTNQVLNSMRELMVEGRAMQRERVESRKAGTTILLGGAIGRIRDALAYRYEAACLESGSPPAANMSGKPTTSQPATPRRPAA